MLILSLCMIFLILQIISNLPAESCLSELEVNIGIYEAHYNPQIYERSDYQPAADDKFVRENDVLIIEGVYAKTNSSCQKIERIIVQFKRPDSEKWGEDIPINLNFSKEGKYSFELLNKPKFNSIIYVESDGNQLNRMLSKILSSEGLWNIRVVDTDSIEENESIRDAIINDNLILSGEILVMNRLEVTQLETLRQIKEESKTTFLVSLIVIILVGIMPIIFHFFWDKKREKEKQDNLLESLYAELDKISSKKGEIKILDKKIDTEGNLQWVKELFGWGLKPAHSIWKLNTEIYIVSLNRTIKGKKTKNLKDLLLHINQKIELIENYLMQYNQLQKENKDVKDSIIKVINEVIELVETAKKLIEQDFKIN